MPAILEFILVCGIMAYLFSWTYAVVTALSLVAYAWFTLVMTNWRLQFRRDMISSDGDAHSKLVDALINYETVKYFNNEAREVSRLDGAFQGYEKAAVRSKVTLSWLNMGQGALINLGGVAVMFLPATFAIAAQIYPANQRGQALGILQMANALGFVGGPVFAGYLLDAFDWTAIFWARIPFAALAVMGAISASTS